MYISLQKEQVTRKRDNRWPDYRTAMDMPIEYMKRIWNTPVFLAKWNNCKVIVKFTLQVYGEKAHKDAAEAGLSPQLLHVEVSACDTYH